MPYSTAVSQALARALGRLEPGTSRFSMPMNAGPIAIKVKDPNADILDLVELLDEGPGGPAPNSWLQRRRAAQNIGRRSSGLVTFDGRICCVEHLRSIDAKLHLLRLPYATSCEECGAEYRIEMGVTTHGR